MPAPKLTKAERVQLEAMQEVLAPWGFACTPRMGGKHLKVEAQGPNGLVLTLTIACTPRDLDDAATYARQQARRELLALNERLGL